MADVNAAAAPFAKTRSSLLSLDEVPHKRHVPAPVLSTYNPLVPEPGTPAFATRQDQFAVDTAAEIKRTDEARRQQKKVDLASYCTYLCLCTRSLKMPTSCGKLQAYINNRRQHYRAAEYKGECEEDRKFTRERERIMNLQATDAGRSNRSGDHFDILTLAYQPSQGGRQLKSVVKSTHWLCCHPVSGPGKSRHMLAGPGCVSSIAASDSIYEHVCKLAAHVHLPAGNSRY